MATSIEIVSIVGFGVYSNLAQILERKSQSSCFNFAANAFSATESFKVLSHKKVYVIGVNSCIARIVIDSTASDRNSATWVYVLAPVLPVGACPSNLSMMLSLIRC